MQESNIILLTANQTLATLLPIYTYLHISGFGFIQVPIYSIVTFDFQNYKLNVVEHSFEQIEEVNITVKNSQQL